MKGSQGGGTEAKNPPQNTPKVLSPVRSVRGKPKEWLRSDISVGRNP